MHLNSQNNDKTLMVVLRRYKTILSIINNLSLLFADPRVIFKNQME